ncbi:hypothetical protein BgAZ_100280 [Babesia gibsoni]|uniref:OPA3-like protein n=1 Tax=Babesia gibsoni TaxID=33632 RepID=A0AAD8PF01_BABGI|nr:hypothetical protein BgAZ_100280 [Babesia gibsoni]
MIPAFKVLAVFVKQLSKPVASYMKKRARESERFRRFCISIGNRGYAFDRYISRRFYNTEPAETDSTPWLSPEKSVVIGTEMFGELIIFGVATIIVASEYARSVRKETKKESVLQNRLHALESQYSAIGKIVQEEVERQLKEKMHKIENKSNGQGSSWGMWPF